ncbi:MAG: hypothetical protein COA99_17820 [Moraxellaceae bacterium]|nr:MAG: hypothetical protein COA99_17820 [Moraxellaceae bacterium]
MEGRYLLPQKGESSHSLKAINSNKTSNLTAPLQGIAKHAKVDDYLTKPTNLARIRLLLEHYFTPA